VRHRALALFLVLGLATIGASQPPVADPDVRRGIALVDEGEYDSAILALDAAVRRLAADKGHSTKDLAEAYFYLGVAYLGKGHETSAKARFREAVQQVRDMSPSPEKFPPRVIELFEKAKEESRAEMPAATSTATPRSAEPAKKGGSKALLVIGGVALAGGGAALALGGGGGGGGGTPTTTLSAQQTFTASGTIVEGNSQYYTFVASRAGTMEATITWQDRSVELRLTCQLRDPPYTQCPGTYNRTTDTTARFTGTVVQNTYLVGVDNYDGRTESFTITIRYP
jgi:tetratricopeptide (TPR) repeat protein